MELQQAINNHQLKTKESPVSPFIEANTIPINKQEIKDSHLLPVFVKDNQPTISQVDFIETVIDVVGEISGKRITTPKVRVSHPIKGRIFEARNKKVAELQEWEKTIYYERMAFICEIPSIKQLVNDQLLTLSFGGVKAYNHDNLNGYGGSLQKFYFFIGFKIKVCTNLCIWTDGYSGELKVRSLDELSDAIYDVLQSFNIDAQLKHLERLSEYSLNEQQFANLLGRSRMYHHLPTSLKKEIPPLLISDSQISAITRTYYKDETFKSTGDGSINLWNLYNLFTGAIKSSYIDSFLDRSVNASELINGIAGALEGVSAYSWFIK